MKFTVLLLCCIFVAATIVESGKILQQQPQHNVVQQQDDVETVFSVAYTGSTELGVDEVEIYKCVGIPGVCSTIYSVVSQINETYFITGLTIDNTDALLYFAVVLYNKTSWVATSTIYQSDFFGNGLAEIFTFEASPEFPAFDTYLALDEQSDLLIFTNLSAVAMCKLSDCLDTVQEIADESQIVGSILDFVYDPLYQNIYLVSLTEKGNAVLWRLTLDGELEFWQLNGDYGTIGIDTTNPYPLIGLAATGVIYTLDLGTMKYTEVISGMEEVGIMGHLKMNSESKMIYWSTVGDPKFSQFNISSVSYVDKPVVSVTTIMCGGENCQPTLLAVTQTTD